MLCSARIWLPLGVLFHALMSSGLSLTAYALQYAGAIATCLFEAGACSAPCRSGWVVMGCLLMLAKWLVLHLLTQPTVCACLATVYPLGDEGHLGSEMLPLPQCYLATALC